jgi:hypothetical protein
MRLRDRETDPAGNGTKLRSVPRCEMWRVSLVLGAVALAVGSCSSSGNSHPISSCDRVMHAAARVDLGTPDRVVGQLDDATLTACTSKAAWLAAAQKYRSAGTSRCVLCGDATGDLVLTALCEANEAKPACR